MPDGVPVGDSLWYRPGVGGATGYLLAWQPQQMSMLAFWAIGLLQDILEGSPLGLHALALMGVAYVCLLSYQRLRNYVLWHQALVVFVIVGVHQLVDNWVHSLSGAAADSLRFLWPAVVSGALWPLVWLLLERWRLRYQIN